LAEWPHGSNPVHARATTQGALLWLWSLSIAAIASRLGLCDIYHFSKLSRQPVG